jgi:hypothetical protein
MNPPLCLFRSLAFTTGAGSATMQYSISLDDESSALSPNDGEYHTRLKSSALVACIEEYPRKTKKPEPPLTCPRRGGSGFEKKIVLVESRNLRPDSTSRHL